MWGEPKQATSATTSLIYITLGALCDVWTVVYYYYLTGHNGSDTAYLFTYGFFATGTVLMLIGFLVGRIGRSARAAEVAAEQLVVPPAAVPVAATPVPREYVPEHEVVGTASPYAMSGHAADRAVPNA